MKKLLLSILLFSKLAIAIELPNGTSTKFFLFDSYEDARAELTKLENFLKLPIVKSNGYVFETWATIRETTEGKWAVPVPWKRTIAIHNARYPSEPITTENLQAMFDAITVPVQLAEPEEFSFPELLDE